MLIDNFEWRLAMFGLVPYFSKDGKDAGRTAQETEAVAQIHDQYTLSIAPSKG